MELDVWKRRVAAIQARSVAKGTAEPNIVIWWLRGGGGKVSFPTAAPFESLFRVNTERRSSLDTGHDADFGSPLE